jgi:REP element-mobilizing transposase RayT
MEKLKPGNYYHIYNRGINSTDLFLEENNFLFFLKQYAFYTHLVIKTYAYCLMKNHFHFLVKIRTLEEQEVLFTTYRNLLKTDKKKWIPHGCKHKNFKFQTASRQLAHLFSKYTKNFNSWNQRTGKLFEQPFKRRPIEDTHYLNHLICYIHRNPIHHGISDTFQSYPHSSYKIILNNDDTLLAKDEVLNFFGGKKQFVAAHEEVKIKITPSLKIE